MQIWMFWTLTVSEIIKLIALKCFTQASWLQFATISPIFIFRILQIPTNPSHNSRNWEIQLPKGHSSRSEKPVSKSTYSIETLALELRARVKVLPVIQSENFLVLSAELNLERKPTQVGRVEFVHPSHRQCELNLCKNKPYTKPARQS